MCKTAAVVLYAALAAVCALQPARIEPVSYRSVALEDPFWSARQRALDETTMRQQFEMLDKYGYRANFQRVAERKTGGHLGFVFHDSDAYKVLEAASYCLGRRRQPWLEAKVDEWIGLIARAQEPDGYLNTFFQLVARDRKWQNLRDEHELYCAGHLFEAAAAHFEATGKRTLLDVAAKLADHIDRRFGPGKRMGYPGHPETELALFKLWRATGERRYFDLAAFFLESRGSKWFATEHGTPLESYNGEYWSDHLRIREHEEIVGHAVRAAYLFSGAADWAHETRDAALLAMLERVWSNTAHKRMFVTGGLGPSGSNEGFTVDYDLPTFTAYQESCASVANALWNGRMGLATGEARFYDVMETALYNGAMAGISLKGDRYFYVNPLASEGGHHRQEWFSCACCPPNLSRIIGQVGWWAYSASRNAIYVNLFAAGRAKIAEAGQDAVLRVASGYPWDGAVRIRVEAARQPRFSLKVRRPGWIVGDVKVNGKPVVPSSDGYLTITRSWRAGDEVLVEFPMPVRRILSHPNAQETAGKFAFARGPIVYCAEGADNTVDFGALGVPLDAPVEAKRVSDPTLGTLVKLVARGFVSSPIQWSGKLYQPSPPPKAATLTAIPYYAWDQRKPGPMRVWFSPSPPPSPLRGLEAFARVELSHTSGNAQPDGANDGFVPAGSNPNSPRQAHFWPRKGGQETIAYVWAVPQRVASARVYWFDDTGRGECRVPRAWRLEAWIGGAWKPVTLSNRSSYGLKLDAWNEIRFTAVTTTSVRLSIDQQEGWASGLHEWQVFSE